VTTGPLNATPGGTPDVLFKQKLNITNILQSVAA